MPHLISNLYEKAYTPFTAKLAPRDLCNRPTLSKLISTNCGIIEFPKITYFKLKPMKILMFLYVCLFNSEKAPKGLKTRS